jgi:hypothetical protein
VKRSFFLASTAAALVLASAPVLAKPIVAADAPVRLRRISPISLSYRARLILEEQELASFEDGKDSGILTEFTIKKSKDGYSGRCEQRHRESSHQTWNNAMAFRKYILYIYGINPNSGDWMTRKVRSVETGRLVTNHYFLDNRQIADIKRIEMMPRRGQFVG